MRIHATVALLALSGAVGAQEITPDAAKTNQLVFVRASTSADTTHPTLLDPDACDQAIHDMADLIEAHGFFVLPYKSGYCMDTATGQVRYFEVFAHQLS